MCVGSKTYKEEYVREETALPDHLIKEVKGITIFEQTHEQVTSDCPAVQSLLAALT